VLVASRRFCNESPKSSLQTKTIVQSDGYGMVFLQALFVGVPAVWIVTAEAGAVPSSESAHVKITMRSSLSAA
jgi:hypothetical protein